MHQATCTVDGCDKPSRNKSAPSMCKMHYHRWYRHGSTDMVATTLSTRAQTGRYRSVHAPSHPVAAPCGRAYVHRMVLFDKIGPGEHACHWCLRSVTWNLPSTDPAGLTADHLNSLRDDNRPENLVPSCMDCNSGRGAQRRHDALVELGYWSNNDTVAALRARGRVSREYSHAAAVPAL